MNSTYVISIIAENTLDIFQRLSVVFSRNRLFINQFNFEASKQNLNSHFYIEISTDEIKMERVVKQLKKIIELSDIKAVHKNHFNTNNKDVYLCQN
ncbi:hypothetical protein [Fluviispira multicolorata]|uniref:Acetolactate synthase-1/3 small subunit n=1 Tax=Fluviispira multicolorata TaxID=2654512 RepID=A0A833JFR3_9BACT|nr:hypothetical protein [Fluviispira multicolorata]KAB8031736.1 hypothetical protein GCL57_03610 [Fluviispira multicolorata]